LLLVGDRVARRLEGGAWMARARGVHEIAARAFGVQRHVIVCGYGRSGQSLARLLEAERVPFIALDHDPRRVRAAASAGDPVVFGDATRVEVLTAAGVQRARAVVISFAHSASALKILAAVQHVRPDAPVIVRTLDEGDLDRLREAGATEVVPEVLEGALMLGTQTLLMAGVPLARVLRRVRQTREARYGAMRGYFRGLTDEHEDDARGERLSSLMVRPGMHALGRSLAELEIAGFGVTVVGLRRPGTGQPVADPDEPLRAGDVLLLRGEAEALASVELALTQG